MARSSGAGQGIGMMGGFFGGGGTGLLNELLMQMDPPPTDQGWKSRLLRVFGLRRKKAEMPPVLTCAATNLVEVLDQALLRPGRFDRKIRVEAPDATGRRDILLYYLAKVAHEPDIDVDRMVNDTMGYTPVAIKYVLNEAAVHAHFDGRTIINYDDFTMARDTHEYGIRQPVKAMSSVDKRRIAYHEAGHTVAQIEYAGITRARFAKVTLMRYGNFGAGVGGFSSTKPTEESVGAATSKEEILAHIKISLASRAAEEQFLGTRLNGVGGDFHSATELAARYLYHWGMAETIVNPTALFGVVTNQVVADNQMQDKVERVLQDQMVEVKELLARRRDDVIAIAEALIARDELNSQDVEDLLRQVQDEKVAAAAAMAVAGAPAVAALAPAATDPGAPTDRPAPPLGGTTAAYQPAPPPARNDEPATADGERPEGRGGSDD
jgi:ATP-dependent Zn protease